MKNASLILIINILFYCQPNQSYAQNYSWAKNIGMANFKDMATDNFGNVYITGNYIYGSTIIIGSDTLTSGSWDHNIFIARFDTAGNYKWIRHSYNSTDQNEEVKGIACDNNGNIYICGYYGWDLSGLSGQAQTSFDNTNFITNPSKHYKQSFIAKFDSTGNCLWLKSVGADFYHDEADDICIDSNGNIFITGWFTGYANFDAITLGPNGGTPGYDYYIAKLSSNGNVIAAIHSGDLSDEFSATIDCNLNQDIIVTGETYGGSIFGSPGTYVNGYTNGLSANSIFLNWSHGSNSLFQNYKTVTTTDGSNNLICAMSYHGTVNIGSYSFTSNLSLSDGAVFIASISPNGNINWAKNFTGNIKPTDVDLNCNGQIQLSGTMKDSVLFDTNLLTSDSMTAFQVTINSLNGNIQSVSKLLAKDDIYLNFKVVYDNACNYYCAGSFLDSVYFPPYSVYGDTSSWLNNIFLAKIDATSTAISDIKSNIELFYLYPNPVNDFLNIESSFKFPASEFILYDAAGRKTMDKKINRTVSLSVKHLHPGIYFYKIRDSKGYEKRGKLIKQ